MLNKNTVQDQVKQQGSILIKNKQINYRYIFKCVDKRLKYNS